jgi:lipoprotein-releasing system permease protein
LLPAGDVPKFYRVIVNQILATNLPDVDAGYLFYQKGQGLSRLQKIGQKKIGFEIWGKDPYDSDSIKERLQAVPGVMVETWQERNSALFSALRMERIVIGLFLGIAALITCFSVVSVMTLLVSQKRKEIGLLRALGFSELSLKKLFLQIGIFLSGLGIVLGVLIGTGLSAYIELNPLRILPDIYYDSEIPAYVNIGFILVTAIVAFAVTYTSIMIILRRAFNEAPSDLLKGI